MGEFLSYSIVSGLYLTALYLAYRVFLAKAKQHGYNRGVLLLIYLISFTALPLTSLAQSLLAQPHIATAANTGAAIIEGPEIAEFVESALATPSKPLWATLIIWAYMAGMAAVAVKTIGTWVRLSSIIRRGEKHVHEKFTLVLTDDVKFAPFSWMHYIVLSKSDYNGEISAVITHEMKHIACRHWIDLLIAQIICIVNWFNPVAWLMRDELMLVHEYQADMSVIDNGHNPKEYQLLLIKKAVGARFPSLANSLNHSKLKKRITMMYKEKSGARQKIKALALVPVFALALCAAGVPAVRATVSTISASDVTVSKSNEKISNSQAPDFKAKSISNSGGKFTVTVTASGLGNELTVSGGEFNSCGKTYKAKGLESSLDNGNATITATFPFISEFDNISMTVNVNNKPVQIDFSSLQSFHNSAVKSSDAQPKQPAVSPQQNSNNSVHKSAQTMPHYPGGERAMMQAINDKVTFPNSEREWEEGASGRTIVQFVVNADGTMGDIKIVRSCGFSDLDEIAIDALKNALTEKWEPGTVDGKPVAVWYTLPIGFKSK